ncbi:CoA ester lyase [Pseudarthrobacter sp. NPDC080039]|uniref:HpcH/HpaI aldolase/citrate lyase family protein n=1 Tax=unclassified Pseudarthrobacter TaxID=2647000 RepID=UPI00344E8761
MKPIRSLLFVPGHRSSWVEKGIASGADGLILDLEDSVPSDLKVDARHQVAHSIRRVRESGSDIALYVRVNALDTRMAGDDIAAVAIPGLTGLSLPKTYGRDDIIRFEALTDHFEARNGVDTGTIEFIINLETAEAYAACDELAKASTRVATLFAGVARDADVSRSIGFQFTPGGQETLYLRSKALLAARAAGLEFPLVGLWQDLADSEGARAFAQQNREMGFRGQVLIHPSHVALANDIYSPSQFEVDFYSGMVAAFDAAVVEGKAAVLYEGMHIDYAHVKTAKEVLAYSAVLASRVAS